MLYDKRWDKEIEIKADPFSLTNLVAWIEKQPVGQGYHFHCARCLLGQYFTDQGINVVTIGVKYFSDESGNSSKYQLPPDFNKIAERLPHTYGAALERARAALAVTSKER